MNSPKRRSWKARGLATRDHCREYVKCSCRVQHAEDQRPRFPRNSLSSPTILLVDAESATYSSKDPRHALCLYPKAGTGGTRCPNSRFRHFGVRSAVLHRISRLRPAGGFFAVQLRHWRALTGEIAPRYPHGVSLRENALSCASWSYGNPVGRP